ncbi:ornithine decarboxylase 1-like, partial [Cochliomyia hominivorax]
LAAIVNKSLNYNFPDNNIEVIAEPGRFFSASAYTLICKIHTKRERKSSFGKLLNKMYYINDGVYGSFNCVLHNHEALTVEHMLCEEDKNLPKFNSTIWGPTCDALDKITENIQLPDLNCDDFLIFPDMGAYSIALSSTFNGFMLPTILYFKQVK